MRMQPLFRGEMLQPDLAPRQDVLEWQVIPGERDGPLASRVGSVNDAPDVVVVVVRVEGDLLL